MKIKKLTVLFASLAMLAACGTQPGKTEDKESSVPAETTSLKSEAKTSEAKTSSETKTSTKTSAQSSTKTSTPASSAPAVPVEQLDKDYTVFTQAPTIRFNTDSDLSFATTPDRTSEKPYAVGTISTEGCLDKYKLDGVAGKMKVRGNYTANYQKKPFKIKFDQKQSMFGLNNGKKFKEWVLLADVKDSAMLRNSTGFYISRNLFGEDIFVSDFTPVHLYIKDQYWGLYLLGEQKEVKSGRVEIEDPEAAGKTTTDTGYFFELDNYYDLEGPDGDPTFTVDYKPAMLNQHHSGENFTRMQQGYTIGSNITNKAVQVPYIKNRLEKEFTVLYDAVMNKKYHEIVDEQLVDSTETDSQTLLAKYFDIDSFVSMFIVSDYVCDPDIGYSSFYLSIDMSETGNKKLTCNCPWDFDSSLGVRAKTVENSQGEYVSRSSNQWLALFSREQWFMNLVAEKWNKAYNEDKLFTRVLDMMDTFSTQYEADYKKNFDRWPGTIGSNREVDFEVRNEVKSFKTEKEAKSFLRSWANKRALALNNLYVAKEIVPPVDLTKWKEGKTATRLEAEDAAITVGTVKENTTEGISGNKYVGDLDGGSGRTLTFTTTAATAKEALLSMGLSARNTNYTLSQLFSITINGEPYFPETDPSVVKGSRGDRDYHYWIDIDVGLFDLKAGENTIVLTSQNTCTNIDYIDIYA
ncbi:MAG: CotH kinase family protein [Bacilli bacterium]|nr:CotH kinase family protein [Bacilli bacterium]